jgi:hypothetical protein
MIAPESVIESVRVRFGRTITEILEKESSFDVYEILGAIEVLIGAKILRKRATSFSERMVFAFVWLARQVQNGGFHQYFSNSAGDYWEEVLKGLIAIGDDYGSHLFRQALAIFPDSTPSNSRADRNAQLDRLEEDNEHQMWEHFSKVSEQYFSKPFPDWALVLNYVQAHSAEFDLDAR